MGYCACCGAPTGSPHTSECIWREEPDKEHPANGGNMNAKELVEALKKASDAYYNTGETLISDIDFDKKVEQLRLIDPDSQFLKTIGAPPVSGKTIKHKIPMGSQEKIKDKNEFDRWCKQVLNINKISVPFVMQHKLDGSSIALNYEKGKLVNAVTRGDGVIGEDISGNVVKMQNVKRLLPVSFTGSIRGEIMLHISTFNEFFKPLGHKNPRNTAAGMSRNQKGNELVKHFKLYYYDAANGEPFETETQKLTFIDKLGLETVFTRLIDSPEKLMEAFNELAKERANLDFEIDGAIFRANSLDVQQELGMSSDGRCPRAQRCYKFESSGAITTLRKVVLTLGHTGAIIPTGKVDPVEIGGVTVSSVLLNNFEFIDRLGIAIGDKVRIVRAGDVIPYAEEVVEKPTNRQLIVTPEKCIVCNSKLIKDGAHIFCRNDDCEGQEFQRLKSYVNKRNIKFLGEELLLELYENHNIKTAPDIYKLTEEYLSKVERGAGVVGSAAKQIFAEIEKSKTCSLADFFGSLGLKLLGRRQAEILIGAGINTFDKFMNLETSDIKNIPGFSTSELEGSKGDIIVEGLKKVKSLVQALLDANVLIVDEEKAAPVEPTSGKFKSLCFCFTGKINKDDKDGNRYTRKMMWDTCLENGGTYSEEVRPGVTHLVQADLTSQSSKTKKALKIGVEIISEKHFFDMLT